MAVPREAAGAIRETSDGSNASSTLRKPKKHNRLAMIIHSLLPTNPIANSASANPVIPANITTRKESFFSLKPTNGMVITNEPIAASR